MNLNISRDSTSESHTIRSNSSRVSMSLESPTNFYRSKRIKEKMVNMSLNVEKKLKCELYLFIGIASSFRESPSFSRVA